jgi:hypothetical protein
MRVRAMNRVVAIAARGDAMRRVGLNIGSS